MIKNSNSQEGQTIVVIIMVMALALAVGVGISSGFIQNLRIVSDIDASSRALAVAEAGVEKVLIIPYSTLEEYIQFSSCGSDCQLSIIGDDGVVATANVLLSFVGNSSDPLKIPLETGGSREVNLTGYTDGTDLAVCWDNPAQGDYPSVYAMNIYGTQGNYGISTYAYNSVSSVYSENGFSTASAAYGYQNCFTVPGQTNQVMLRLKAYYNNFDVYIVPQGGANIPVQGIQIESTGRVLDTTRRVVVVRSASYLPSQFENVLWQRSLTEPLSN